MFRSQRTARIRPGKLVEAFQWAREIAEYTNEKYAPVSTQAYSEVFGDYGKVHWHTDFEDLATYEKASAQLMADQEYWAMLNEGAELFIEGSVHDTLIQSL
jgi:hypothetical protein